MKDTDIDGLNPEDARQYVLQFIISLKQTQTRRRELTEELATWRRRAALAAEKPAPDLEAQARLQVDELTLREAALAREESALTVKVDVLKEKLSSLRLRGQMQVDADALLARLQQLAGPRDPLTEALREEEANQLLAELKERLENEDS